MPSGRRDGQGAAVLRAGLAPGSLTPREVLQLQRAVGNRAVGEILSGAARPPREEEETAQLRAEENRTGLPDAIKAGVENLSGLSLDDVKVHYNSPKPAELQALAYTQGTNIHVAPGEERHLAHEAWHVVQQKRGAVKPTLMLEGTAVNNDHGLEGEATRMGDRAMTAGAAGRPSPYGAAPRGVAQLAGAVVQREIKISNIDYNPDDKEFLHGSVENDFFGTLTGKLQADKSFKGKYVDKAADVMRAVREQDFEGADIDTLTESITDALVETYKVNGVPAWPDARVEGLKVHVRASLLANLGMTGRAMDAGERDAFDVLVRNAAAADPANLSMAKRNPNVIPFARLPGALQTAVTTVYDDIRTEDGRWGLDMLRDFVEETVLVKSMSNALSYYQGNHTNNAGWLPAVALPVSPVAALYNDIYGRVGASVRKKMRKGGFISRLGDAPPRERREFDAAFDAATVGRDDAWARQAAWTALAAGVSAYIEFSLPGPISRLVFDFVNHEFYLTAHYKWRGGYNPFFRVTGLAAF